MGSASLGSHSKEPGKPFFLVSGLECTRGRLWPKPLFSGRLSSTAAAHVPRGSPECLSARREANRSVLPPGSPRGNLRDRVQMLARTLSFSPGVGSEAQRWSFAPASGLFTGMLVRRRFVTGSLPRSGVGCCVPLLTPLCSLGIHMRQPLVESDFLAPARSCRDCFLAACICYGGRQGH